MHQYKRAIIAHIGPMFGGKTSGLLADIRKMRIAKYHVALFKPIMDDRYSNDEVVNHDGEKIKANNVYDFYSIYLYAREHKDVNVIAIDEFQFLDTKKMSVKEFVNFIIKNGLTLLFSGLDLDSDLQPFDNVKEILPYSTYIFKHKAVCVCCGNDAIVSFCKINKDGQNLVGGSDTYEPRCLKCYLKDHKL